MQTRDKNKTLGFINKNLKCYLSNVKKQLSLMLPFAFWRVSNNIWTRSIFVDFLKTTLIRHCLCTFRFSISFSMELWSYFFLLEKYLVIRNHKNWLLKNSLTSFYKNTEDVFFLPLYLKVLNFHCESWFVR